MVELPTVGLRERSELWMATTVEAKCLGRRMVSEMVAQDFWIRAGVKGTVAVYGLEREFLLFQFGDSTERDAVPRRPWNVAEQPLALEPWWSGFFPADGAISTALVWIRLSQLPVEYWEEVAIREIVRPVEEFFSVDECISEIKQLGFVRVYVKIDLSRPLRPGVLVGGLDGPFWQRFVFENLEGVCLNCGFFHKPEERCRTTRKSGSTAAGLVPALEAQRWAR
ncbi:uncharacterized protein [Elaeis guineensis]|uniref:Uncharacterized protein LOC105056359 n=1 Tax=Elaeis guineensis var. tenera TaxID=51953 RepID=A0A6I9S357_ELAGV|nr:uncharacterized protein LOC105056359 [Elaeis guineensis]